MSYNKKQLLALSVSLLAATTLHADTIFPRGCEVSGYGFKSNYLILNEQGAQTIYFIQNRSPRTIELEHAQTADEFMSPKLETKLSPQNWAAFASDVQNMNFKCSAKIGEEKIDLNCNEVLDICQFPRVKFALSNMGNYWVSTNKSRELVVKDTVDKGIYLRW